MEATAHMQSISASRELNWPEYAIEAALLGAFMVSACVMTVLIEHPASSVYAAIPDAFTRRALIGIAMGLTAVGLIHSPWGQQSGAHFNPSVTLTFLRLGKIEARDACAYVVALAMLAAAELYIQVRGAHRVLCAKLNHDGRRRCIFRCAYCTLREV